MLTEEQFGLVFAWVDGLVSLAQVSGRPLTGSERQIAVEAGIGDIDKIRIQEVDQMPAPPEEMTNLALLYLDPRQAGLTLGHVVLILRGHLSDRLLKHEFCHVRQVEELGGVEPFLRTYIEQVLQFGYEHAPLEAEARALG